MTRTALPRLRCSCLQLVPVTRARRVRAHSVIPGGQERCARSGEEVAAGAMVVPPPLAIAVTYRLRSEAELARWCGPRRWEEADF
jgi:hypothetical protein